MRLSLWLPSHAFGVRRSEHEMKRVEDGSFGTEVKGSRVSLALI